jgi:alpha-tubulin suppressor-like RCC1 family protein
LFTWGYNFQGQLGLGTSGAGTYKSSPNQVGSLTTWLKIAAGYYCNGTISTGGALWTWGYNSYGQLGLGNTTRYSSPKQVGSLTTWSTISINQRAYQMVSIKTDGTLWMWGYNAYGNLGVGNTTNYSSPKQVGSLTTWSKASTNQSWVIAIATT